jgi:D-sedoheptulose 7-phosphate isomerase
MNKIISDYLETLIDTLRKVDTDSIEKIAKTLIFARNSGKHIYVFGNGGSGSTASHMVCDILKGCSYGFEKRFKITCLNDNIPTILAYSNDVSYDVVFEEQLKNYLNEGDIVIGISGSGNSVNVIKAIEFANTMNSTTIGLTGFSGGELINVAQIVLHIPIDDMQISEDIHFIVNHILYKIFTS